MESHIELINLLELEKCKGYKTVCPVCSNDSIVKKSSQLDVPKAVGFMILLASSFAIVIIINIIVFIRHKIKIKQLPKEIKDQIKEEDSKFTLLGLHAPTKTKISCSKCEYIFYENYDGGDLIVVTGFFLMIMLIVIFVVFYLSHLR